MRRRPCRDIDGILLLDKPCGLTSNQALQETKRLLGACKAGHTGSLDPIASGLLPLCFGEATKVSRFLLEADKRYWTAFRLGQSTTTYDAEGEVTRERPVQVTPAQVERALARFRGEIEQVPPAYSAVKRAGQPLYRLARAGVEVAVEARRVLVHEARLLRLEGERLELEISCSKGTYIRSLAHDLGEALGCGAHVTELRRLGLGGFRVEQAVGLEALRAMSEPQRESLLLGGDQALARFPEITLSANAAYYLRQGQPVVVRGRPAGLIRVYEEGRAFLGLGEVLDDGRLAPRRLVRS
jgi:tRNA pseudouridine55 synthase